VEAPTSKGQVTLVVVDDHHLMRTGLRTILSSIGDIEVVGEAANAREGLDVVQATSPDVILLDVALPGLDGIAAAAELRRRRSTARVLMLSMHTDRDYVIRAFAAGAVGYAVKDQPPPDIIEAIRHVARGERYFAPQIPHAVRNAVQGGKSESSFDALTPREREILDLILRDYSSINIAAELSISVKTVETHRAAIHRKLGVHSNVGLVRLAAARGVLPG
jgi:DNA-binding NarL/FixJ family response regulator